MRVRITMRERVYVKFCMCNVASMVCRFMAVVGATSVPILSRKYSVRVCLSVSQSLSIRFIKPKVSFTTFTVRAAEPVQL